MAGSAPSLVNGHILREGVAPAMGVNKTSISLNGRFGKRSAGVALIASRVVSHHLCRSARRAPRLRGGERDATRPARH